MEWTRFAGLPGPVAWLVERPRSRDGNRIVGAIGVNRRLHQNLAAADRKPERNHGLAADAVEQEAKGNLENALPQPVGAQREPDQYRGRAVEPPRIVGGSRVDLEKTRQPQRKRRSQ